MSDVVADIESIIDEVGAAKDNDIHLANAALAVAAFDSPGILIQRYQLHIEKMVEEVGTRHQKLLSSGADDDAATQLAALKHVIADTHGYVGDNDTYDDLQNVNLIRVIERRKGMPIAISLLYIHAANEMGWQAQALNFPAHVVCRIEKAGQRILFDPFNRCEILQAPDLRRLLKTLVSDKAELSADYYEPSTRRDILIRMQNNIKLRKVESEDYEGAAKTVEVMQRLAPDEYRLLLDAGVLYARINQANAAVLALEAYIERTPNRDDQQEALALLQQIRRSLN